MLSQTMRLSLEVQPVFARVLLDGVLLTSQKLEYVIPKDGRTHTIRVESSGWKTRQLEFKAERDVHFVVALDLLPPRK